MILYQGYRVSGPWKMKDHPQPRKDQDFCQFRNVKRGQHAAPVLSLAPRFLETPKPRRKESQARLIALPGCRIFASLN